MRKNYICKNQIEKGLKGVREALAFFKKGKSLAIMIDQRVTEGERINFFGHPALTTTLPAQLALKFNIPIVPVFIERKGDAYFEIEFLTANKNAELLVKQSILFSPKEVVIVDDSKYIFVKSELESYNIKVYSGSTILNKVVQNSNSDLIL